MTSHTSQGTTAAIAWESLKEFIILKMQLQKQKVPKAKSDRQRKENYLQSGDLLTKEEFISMVNEADASGYISSEEFKKKCQALLRSK